MCNSDIRSTESILRQISTFFEGHREFLDTLGQVNFLLAVSGGADSAVMLHALHSMLNRTTKESSDYECIKRRTCDVLSNIKVSRIGVAHVNFHLRGEDSNRDQEFVRVITEQYGYEFYTVDFDTLSYAAQYKLSVEIAARRLRYAWFEELACSKGFNVLLTAHNANDNAETLLLNLVRGTGRRGLGGIRPCGPVTKESEDNVLYVMRPMLYIERSEIEKYALEHGVGFCTDSTNLQNNYSRNKIRNQIMPLLKEINPSVISSFSRDISRLRDMNAELDNLADVRIKSFVALPKTTGCALVDSLRERYLIGRISIDSLYNMSSSEAGSISFWLGELFRFYAVPQNEASIVELLKALNKIKAAQAPAFGSRVFYMQNCMVTIEAGELRLYKADIAHIAEAASQRIDLEKVLSNVEFLPFEIKIERRKFKQTGLVSDSKHTFQAGICILDAATLHNPLYIRAFEDGDKFTPYGMKGVKSIADFLNSRKVDLLFKKILPIVTEASGIIVCIPSVEIDNRYRVTEQTEEIVIVSAVIR